MKKALIICAVFLSLLLLPHFVAAQTLGVHTLSRHDPGNGANDWNFGAYYISQDGYVAGSYYNSHFRQSFYAGYSHNVADYFRVSIVGVTGYFAPITPVIVPSLRIYTDGNMSVWVSGSPVKIHNYGRAVQHITLEVKL